MRNVALRQAHRATFVGLAHRSYNCSYRFYVDVAREPEDFSAGDVVLMPAVVSANFTAAHGPEETIRSTMRRQAFPDGDDKAYYRRDYYAEVVRHAAATANFEFLVIADDDGLLCGPQLAAALEILGRDIHRPFVLGAAYYKRHLSGIDQSFALLSGLTARHIAHDYWARLRASFSERRRDINFNTALTSPSLAVDLDLVVPPTCPSTVFPPWAPCPKSYCQPSILHVHDAGSVVHTLRTLSRQTDDLLDVCGSGLIWLDKVKSSWAIRAVFNASRQVVDEAPTLATLRFTLLEPTRLFFRDNVRPPLSRSHPAWCPFAHSVRNAISAMASRPDVPPNNRRCLRDAVEV